jgi:hypothetical protein
MMQGLVLSTPHARSFSEDGDTAAWLLDGPAQIGAGHHAGAVAGSIDGDGRATYGYPEITGYYLQWLAWRSCRDDGMLAAAPRAAAAQRWLAGWLAIGEPLPMRLHLAGDVDDWRNRAVFCFDVAMVLRGLAAAANTGLIDPDPAVVAGLSNALVPMIADDGMFNAFAPSDAVARLPARWSTRRGAFLAKAGAGVTAAAALPGIASRVVAAAEATWLASLESAFAAPHDELHPQLYAFEGILSRPRHPRTIAALPRLAAAFDALLALRTRRGALPESRRSSGPVAGPERIDVIAQTLRIGYLLQRSFPQWVPDRVALARLRHLLRGQVRADGSVPFAIEAQVPVSSVWAAMFADQAIAMAYGSSPVDANTTDPLLV